MNTIHCSVFVSLVLGVTTLAQAATIKVPADQPTIQAALTAAGPGDLIEVSPGTYAENLTVSTKVGVTLIGTGKGKVVVDASGGLTALSIQSCIAFFVERIEFQGALGDAIVIDSNCASVLFEDVKIRDCGAAGVQCAADGALFKDVTISDTASTGIIGAGDALLVSQCRIERAGFEGVRVSGARCVISRNTILDSTASAITVGQTAATTLVARNTITAQVDGIRVEENATSTTLLRNVVKSAGNVGISTDSDDIAVIANQVSNTMFQGIAASALTFKGVGNSVKSAGSPAGISLDSDCAACSLVSNAVQKSANHGVFIDMNSSPHILVRNVAKKSDAGVDFATFEPLANNTFYENVFKETGP